jgi:hypothetical protein
MNKIMTAILILQLSLLANTFEWSSKAQAKSADNSLSKISQMIEEDINKFVDNRTPLDVSSAIPSVISKPELPPKIAMPTLPEPIKLIRGEFEKTSDFERRVQDASRKRDLELKKLQEEYRVKVEKRNKTIEQLSKEYNLKVAQRNAIIKNIQAIKERDNERMQRYHAARKEQAYMQLEKFAKPAVDKVYGEAKLLYKAYDPDSDTLYLIVTSSDGKNFRKEIEVKATPIQAKKLKETINTITPKVMFDIYWDDNNAIKFDINSITFKSNTQLYVAQDVSSDYIAKPMQITIKNKEVTFTDINSTQLSLQENEKFILQNPNLNDKIILGAVAYNATGAIVGSNVLMNAAKALPKIPTNPHRWLFMIAIENYAETDNVLYATRSAEALEKTMQKRLGIDNQHTYALFNEKATSGAIKDKIHALLAKVKSNDTIYFYYSGHGVPGSNGDAYILPEDKIVDFIDKDAFFKLENIYKELSLSRAKHSFVFIDACFSGKTDNELIFKGVAPGLIKAKKVTFDKERLTVITAGKDTEFSNMYKDKRYRLFSYYLTKALLDNQNDISQLYKRVNYEVIEKSSEIGDRYRQTPQIYGNTKVRLF